MIPNLAENDLAEIVFAHRARGFLILQNIVQNLHRLAGAAGFRRFPEGGEPAADRAAAEEAGAAAVAAVSAVAAHPGDGKTGNFFSRQLPL